MSKIELMSAGMLTTVQDLGRSKLQHLGIPAGGPMDIIAAKVANALVGNDFSEAVLECTYIGPVIKFHDNATIALTGANLNAKLNGYLIDNYLPIQVKLGDTLDLSEVKSGLRVYFAIAGGIQTEKVLGSRATYLPMQFGKDDKKLRNGDFLPFISKLSNNYLSIDKRLKFRSEKLYKIRIVEGPQIDYFAKEQRTNLADSIYQVSPQSDRMGVRFIGTNIFTDKADMISDGIPLGSVQITRGGQPIIMMADRQPTGGYPKIAKVIELDISKIAQLKPGDKIQFEWISLEESLRIKLEVEKMINNYLKLVKDAASPRKTYRIYIKDRLYQTSIYEK